MKSISIKKLENFSLENFEEIVSGSRKIDCEKTEILVLPYRYNDDYYFANEAINFIKYSRFSGNAIDIDVYSDMENIKIRALHSYDIWMPILYISSTLLFPIVVNVASDYISDRIRGKEHEESNVKFTMIINDGHSVKEIKYDGDAKTFREKFENIDITKM